MSMQYAGGHPALSDVTPCLLGDFFENSGGTPHPISYCIAPSDFESQILHPPPPPPPFLYIWYFSYLYNCIKHNMNM